MFTLSTQGLEIEHMSDGTFKCYSRQKRRFFTGNTVEEVQVKLDAITWVRHSVFGIIL